MSQYKARGGPSPAKEWKERAEELEDELDELQAEAEDLKARLSDIADIAAPERAQADARIDWLVEQVARLIEVHKLPVHTLPGEEAAGPALVAPEGTDHPDD